MRYLNAYEKGLYLCATGRPAPWCLIQRWPWWYRDFRGIALGCFILVKQDNDPVLLCHEAVHVAQFYAAPLTFWFRYLLELHRVGYVDNCYECQARTTAAKAGEIALATSKSIPAAPPL